MLIRNGLKTTLRAGGRSALFFFLLAFLTMLLLLGSGRSVQSGVAPSEAETTALRLGENLPRADREMWQKAAKERPLWLLQVSSF